MRTVRAWLHRLAGLFTTRRRAADQDAELRSHLQLHIDDNLRAGMTPDEARRCALVALGGLETTREAYGERGTLPFAEHVVQDVRFALRQLRRRPGVTTAAAGVLALGIAASASIFAFVDAALIEPLPYRSPDRLLAVTEGTVQIPRANLSYADYLDWKRQATTLASLDVHNGTGFLVGDPGSLQAMRAARVSPGFFRTLGVAPLLGRDFMPRDEPSAHSDEVILAYSAWRGRFGGRTDVIGETVRLNGEPRTVVGVLPATFHFGPRGAAELWVPIGEPDGCEARRSCHNLEGIARLKDDATVEQARTELTAIAAELERQYPDSNRGQFAVVTPLADVIVGDIAPALLALLGGAALLLLVACINVAGLQVLRTESRQRELAVRAAMGATRLRLSRQVVTECALLVLAAGGAGLAVSHGIMPALGRLVPADMAASLPFLAGLTVNTRVLAATGGVCLLAIAVLSAAAIARIAPAGTHTGLNEGSRGSSGRTWQRLGSRLVVTELMLAVVMLVAATLLVRSVDKLLRVELAFNPAGLATLGIVASGPGAADDVRVLALARAVIDRVEHLPGIVAAGTTSVLPVSFNGNTDWIRFVGRPYDGERNEVNWRVVSERYFPALQVPLVAGRHFTERDDAAHPRVAIVNRTLARLYFPGLNPVGQRFGDTSLSPDSIKEIVGVVDDVREGPLDSDIWPAVYYPSSQAPRASFELVVRTAGDPAAMLPAIDSAVRGVDSGIVTLAQTTMERRIGQSPSAYLHRSTALVAGGFAGLAWLLGAVGLYSVMAFLVVQRTREIGVRMALGAQRGSVSRMVMAQAGRLALIGIAGGLLLGMGAAMLIADLLFGTPPWDASAFAVAVVALAASSMVAAWIPARRAASIDPIEALRAE